MNGGVVRVRAQTVRALLLAHKEPVHNFMADAKRVGTMMLPQGCKLYANKNGACWTYSIGWYGAGDDLVRLTKVCSELKEELESAGWKQPY